jgi:hypothetical protein
MDQSQALSVVRSLANGVDPETGEVFAADSVYQRAQTVRALYAAAEALEKAVRFERRTRELPAKTGDPGPRMRTASCSPVSTPGAACRISRPRTSARRPACARGW